MSIDTGGPAFPQCSYNMKGGYDITGGATIRDYFAAKAMQGLIHHFDFSTFRDDPKRVAAWAYEVADYMLEKRNK